MVDNSFTIDWTLPENQAILRQTKSYVRTPEIREHNRRAALALNRKGEKAAWYGKHHTQETKEKIRQGELGKIVTEETRHKMQTTNSSPEVREKHRKLAQDRWDNQEYKQRVTESIRKSRLDPHFRQRMTEANLERWSNPDYKDRVIRSIRKSVNSKPNTKESQLWSVLNTLFPNQYQYTGNGSVVLNGLCPDFSNVNGQKKLVELFGDYWHRGQNPQGRIDKFTAFGYQCLIVWEHELEDLDTLATRLIQFNAQGFESSISHRRKQ